MYGTVLSVLKVCGLNFFLCSFVVSLGKDLFALVLLCQSIVRKKKLSGMSLSNQTTRDSHLDFRDLIKKFKKCKGVAL